MDNDGQEYDESNKWNSIVIIGRYLYMLISFLFFFVIMISWIVFHCGKRIRKRTWRFLRLTHV